MRAAFICIHHHDRINTIEILFDGISILLATLTLWKGNDSQHFDDRWILFAPLTIRKRGQEAKGHGPFLSIDYYYYYCNNKPQPWGSALAARSFYHHDTIYIHS
jgi:hypothetical protein